MTGYEGAAGAAQFASDLRRVPDVAKRALVPALREAGQMVRDAAAANASWSSRIPGAIVVQARLSGAKPDVYITVRQGQAPHARPYEGIGRGGSFRHPLNYPNQSTWVSQACRPFLVPAFVAQQGAALASIEGAVAEAISSAV